MNHLVILPILIPLFGAACSLFVEHRRYGPKVQRSVAWTTLPALLVAVAIGNQRVLRRFARSLPWLERASGVMLVALALALLLHLARR